jgi:hypothetical protein
MELHIFVQFDSGKEVPLRVGRRRAWGACTKKGPKSAARHLCLVVVAARIAGRYGSTCKTCAIGTRSFSSRKLTDCAGNRTPPGRAGALSMCSISETGTSRVNFLSAYYSLSTEPAVNQAQVFHSSTCLEHTSFPSKRFQET